MNQLTAEEVFDRLKDITLGGNVCRFPLPTCERLTPMINEIIDLKKEKDAVILAHSYVSPEILYTVADFVGDSYKLSVDAMKSDKSVIVFSAVKFMAETAKILNPSKKVLVPSKVNGCSLADSITEDDMVELKKKYPDHGFICYINTTAEVKAYCDVTVTSSNVYDIVECYPNDKLVFLPDKLMGENVIEEMTRRGVDKEIILYEGNCYVHDTYDPEVIEFLKNEMPELEVVVHPECNSEVVKQANYVGSTSQMMNYIQSSEKQDFFVLTECGLIDRLQKESPEKNYIGSCTMCRYMKSNGLEDILRVLKSPDEDDEVNLSPEMIALAKGSLDNMFTYTKK